MTILFSALGYLYTHILPFIILLGILIFVHELGHFLVARYCNVRVEVFSLGFGKKLLSFKHGDTVYCLSLIPLGGYVKMFGEQGSDSIKTEEDKKVSYSHKTPWQRIAIVLAGPLMNLFFAIFVFAFVAQSGEKTRSAIVADVEVGSAAAQMGLKAGDRIVEANFQPIQSYEEFQKKLNEFKGSSMDVLIKEENGLNKRVHLSISAVDNPNLFSTESKIGQVAGLLPFAKSAAVTVIYESPAYKAGFRNGDEIVEINSDKIQRFSQLSKYFVDSNKEQVVKVIRSVENKDTSEVVKTDVTITVAAQKESKKIKTVKSLEAFGFDNPELYIDQVMKGSPAERAELQKFDKIVSINSIKITKWEHVAETVKSYDGKEALTFVVIRDGTEVVKKITPEVTEINTAFGGIDKRFAVGITSFTTFAEPEYTIVKSASIFHALAKGVARSYDVSVMTIMSFVKLFQGHVSVKNVGGMVSIGKAAKDSFETGAQAFLMTMGILSISLFILNLLPIPVLDGGHLVFYTIELIKGSPLSLRKMEIAQQVGLVLLLGLMILAQYNDIVKFLFKS